jgi:DNA ligase 1
MFRPLLAPREDPLSYPDYFRKLQYPLLVSPKYDGIRCIIKNGVALSRTGKPLPSFQVQQEFTNIDHFDGELIVGNPRDTDVYNRTQSHVMSQDKPADISYYVFDYTHPEFLYKPFYARTETLSYLFETLGNKLVADIRLVKQMYIESEKELLEAEQKYLEEGYEGIMLRDPVAPYKNGRGTFREGIIYKLKRFTDDEAVVIGFKEKLTNTNELEVDELGYAKRSHKQAGKVGSEMVGAFYVEFQGTILEIAPGSFKHEELIDIWEHQEIYLGRILKFRFFSYGLKDKPRFPRAVGWRTRLDL